MGRKDFVLIETLWNVKLFFSFPIQQPSLVLIETLWNVKIFAFGYFCHQAFVLIETLWNVKRNRIEPKLFGNFGINRNIMECKDQLTRIGYGHILY